MNHSMLKPGQTKKFRKGNLAVVQINLNPVRSYDPKNLLALWSEPPTDDNKESRIIGDLRKNDLVLVIQVENVHHYLQYSRIFSMRKNVTGWVNSKFLEKIKTV